METNVFAIVAMLATLAYTLIGLRAMLHIDAAFGPRYLPRTNWGTWASIVVWPAWWLLAAARYWMRANRRIQS